MKNTVITILLSIIIQVLFCFTAGKVYAQNTNRDKKKHTGFRADSGVYDSLGRDSTANTADTIRMGETDGRRLRLSTIQRQKFSFDGKNAGSDLFKPTLYTVPDTTMLKDSAYVKAFRIAAYKRAIKDGKQSRGNRFSVPLFP